MFVFNAQVNKTILFLIGYLAPIGIYGIYHYTVFFNDSPLLLVLFNVHFVPVYYLTGPMIYFYVRSTLRDNNSLHLRDYIHFVPSLIGLVSILPYILSDLDYKIAIAQQMIDNPNSIKDLNTNWFYPNYINVLARPTLLFGYGLGCIIMILKFLKRKKHNIPFEQKNKIVKWLYTISIINLLISLSYLMMTYWFLSNINFNKNDFNQLNVTIATGFLYASIPIIIFIFPEILYGIPKSNDLGQKFKEKEKISRAELLVDEKISYSKSETKHKNDPFYETANAIIKYMETQKPYLRQNFSIDHIISDLNIPKHHVFYCFKNIIKEKFTTLKNKLRVNYAKTLLTTDQVKFNTIEGIGFNSGFSSKSSFFETFKKLTGLTPQEFILLNKKNNIPTL
jgi:AraC-like DNA-binding protein